MSLCHSSCNELLLLLTCNSCNAWVLTYKCLRQSAQHDLFPRNVLKAEERLLVEKRIMTLIYTPTFCVSIWIFFKVLPIFILLVLCAFIFTISARTETQRTPSECKKSFFQCEDDFALGQIAQCSCRVSIPGGEWSWAACCSLPWTSQKCLPASVVLCPSVLSLLAVLQ